MAVPVKSKPTFIHPSKDIWRAYATYVIFWNLRISNPVFNQINKVTLGLGAPPLFFDQLKKDFCEKYC